MTLAGQYLGHYRIVRQIGQGGMGEVYLAEDNRITRQIAIKVVRSERVPYPNDSATQEAARLFQREMKVISQLDHSHILSVYDFGEEPSTDGSIIYMVMPYRPEGSLADWLAQRSSSSLLSPQDVSNLIMQASSALQHAHDRNIVHQDVKPSNFLIRENSEHPTYPDLFLVDFGIAKVMTGTSKASNSVRGTYTYMAPEQWSGTPVPATDQYALAIMAYQLLTGVAPFQGRSEQIMYQHLTVAPKPPSIVNPGLSPKIDAVLLRALAKNHEERFPSISAFFTAFRQALEYDRTDPTFILSTPGVETNGIIAPTVTAPPLQPMSFSSSFPGASLPVSSVEKRRLPFPFYIIGALLLVGVLVVGAFSFGLLSAKHTPTSNPNGGIATIATATPSHSSSANTPTGGAAPVVTTIPSPPTPANTSAPAAIAYPTYDAAKADIKYYYENKSDFAGKNVIQSFDSLTYNQFTGPSDQPQFIACSEYKFALVSSPDVTADTARHTFTFQYGNGSWSVIDIGNWNSC